MKAVVCEKKGTAGVFTLREVKKPAPKENEVLVKIHAASVNALDYRTIRMGLKLPESGILGADIAGRVEAVGSGVKKFKPGDEVFGDIFKSGCGGFAEFAAVLENALVLKPAAVPFDEAASMPVAAITALQALRDKGGIKPGKKVMIYGAGGGVGTFAVQLARYFGAEVTAICGPGNTETMRALGADHIVDYTREDVFTSNKRYDIIAAVNGLNTLRVYRRALAPGGVLVVAGGAISQITKAMLFGSFMSIGNRKIRFLAGKPNEADLLFLIGLVAEGRIKPVIDRRYALKETADAMRYMEKGHSRGKVVITVIEEKSNSKPL